jgi:hypothetical protein
LHLQAKPAGANVALSGQLSSLAQRELMEALARDAAGGRALDVSGLRVGDSRLAAELKTLVSSLSKTLGPAASAAQKDLLIATAAAQIQVEPGDGNPVHLAGTAPTADVKRLIRTLAAGLAEPREVDDSGVRVEDGTLDYVIRAGDAPESIARRLCGSWRKLERLRIFSHENSETLTAMRIGSIVRIPKSLLVHHAQEK